MGNSKLTLPVPIGVAKLDPARFWCVAISRKSFAHNDLTPVWTLSTAPVNVGTRSHKRHENEVLGRVSPPFVALLLASETGLLQ